MADALTLVANKPCRVVCNRWFVHGEVVVVAAPESSTEMSMIRQPTTRRLERHLQLDRDVEWQR